MMLNALFPEIFAFITTIKKEFYYILVIALKETTEHKQNKQIYSYINHSNSFTLKLKLMKKQNKELKFEFKNFNSIMKIVLLINRST